MVYSPVRIICEMGTKVYPSWSRVWMMVGRASGVWRAALWNRTMDPGWTLEVTRLVMSAADRSFQSRLSPSVTKERWIGWKNFQNSLVSRQIKDHKGTRKSALLNEKFSRTDF